jgi:ABC-2 type transport system permease protein
MKIIWHLAAKEFKLLFRDKVGLFWAFGFPVLISLFFVALFGGSGSGGSGIKIAIIDEDDSKTSRKFVEELKASPSLKVETPTLDEARAKVRQGKLAAYLLVNKGFGETAGFFGGSATVELGLDPSRRAEEGFLQGILMQAAVKLMQEGFTDPARMAEQTNRAREAIAQSTTLSKEQRESLDALMSSVEKWSKTPLPKAGDGGAAFDMQPLRIERRSIEKETSGPKSAFDITFPQGVMWGILGTITAFAVGLVLERSNGTMLRLRLAPIRFDQLLAGKALACFLTCMMIVSVILLFGRLLFGVHFDQPVMLLVTIVASGVCYTGIMMLLSTIGRTERAVGGIGWGVLMPLTMIGGGTIPLFFMPAWLQTASDISPIKWSILGMEGAMWRGLSWGEMLAPIGIQLAIGVACFALGVWRVKRQEL